MSDALPTEEEIADLGQQVREKFKGEFFEFASEVMENMPRDVSPRSLGLDESFVRFIQTVGVTLFADPTTTASHLIAIFTLGMEYQKKLDREAKLAETRRMTEGF